jgi:hypothetical protein
MKADLELTLTFDGNQWTVHNDVLIAIGESFETLDMELTRTIRSSGYFPAGSRVKVFMGFDGKPCGYNNRYFNRCVDLEV